MAQFARPGAGWASNASFQLARGRTLAIPMSVHAAARSKLVKAFADNGVTSGIVLMQGGDDQNQYDTDTELIFRWDHFSLSFELCIDVEVYHCAFYFTKYCLYIDRILGLTTFLA